MGAVGVLDRGQSHGQGGVLGAGRAGPSAGAIAGTAVRAGARDGTVCPNLLQRPRSRRNAGRETLIFRASSRRRSRPGAPLQQIRTRPRPGSPQKPHPHHPAPAHPRQHADPGWSGEFSGEKVPLRLLETGGVRRGAKSTRRPSFSSRRTAHPPVHPRPLRPSPSATPLHPPPYEKKKRSGGRRSAADAKRRSRRSGAASRGPRGRRPGAPRHHRAKGLAREPARLSCLLPSSEKGPPALRPAPGKRTRTPL